MYLRALIQMRRDDVLRDPGRSFRDSQPLTLKGTLIPVEDELLSRQSPEYSSQHFQVRCGKG
jgi:hypothetical protein